MATILHTARRLEQGNTVLHETRLAPEAPLQITVNGLPYATTLRTPGADAALARGLLHAEDLIADATPFTWEDVPDPETGYTGNLRISVPEESLKREIEGMHSLAATAACGLCSTRRLEDIMVYGDSIHLHLSPLLTVAALHDLFHQLYKQQPTFDQTGGCHAAALANPTGQLITVHEDVGRHNAVDKAVGTLLLANRLAEATVLLVSGRVSYEIVAKAYRAAVPIVAAVSAPSSMAVEYGQRLGITLLGFCRDDRATVYTHPERIDDGLQTGSTPP